MNALTSFLSKREADSLFYCPCCKSHGLDASDMVLSDDKIWTDRARAAAAAKYNAPICHGCMDNHLWTADDFFVHRDHAVLGSSGEYWADASALWEYEAECADWHREQDYLRWCAR
jgi:hypothetical protein